MPPSYRISADRPRGTIARAHEPGGRRRMSILRFLGYDPDRAATAHESAETDTVRKIVAALDRLEPDRARPIAIFAYILSRVARADLVISDAETRAMEAIVMQAGGLAPQPAVLVGPKAQNPGHLFGGPQDHPRARGLKKAG